METAIEHSTGNGAIQPSMSEAIERVLVTGDLAALTSEQRVDYYNRTCMSLDLNPLTRPFEYITLNGKLTLYARKDCTDQLRSLRNVSIQITSREQVGDVYVVTARATLSNGRSDESTGAVDIKGLSGDKLANALMKAETKSKRRATLSICGLGITDETELDTIPGAKAFSERPPTRKLPAGTAGTGNTGTINISHGFGSGTVVEYVDAPKEPHEMTTLEKIDVYAKALPNADLERKQTIGLALLDLIETKEELIAIAKALEKEPLEVKAPMQEKYRALEKKIKGAGK